MSELKDYVLTTPVINKNIVETLDESGQKENFKTLKVKILNPNNLTYEIVGSFIVESLDLVGIIPFISESKAEANFTIPWVPDKTYIILNPFIDQNIQFEVTTGTQYNQVLPYNDKDNQVVLLTTNCVLTIKALE